VQGVKSLFKEGMKDDITKADAVDNVCPVLAYIGTSPPSRVIDWIVYKLVNFLATREDDVALFEF
jgi:hypothetical protein